MTIADKLLAYHGIRGEHDRDRSWEHCYRYFNHTSAEEIKADRDHAALHLGFYLASWGMYRPSAFLFQHAYTVHLSVVDCLLQPGFSKLWNYEFGSSDLDMDLVPLILEACDGLRAAYSPFGRATDTLVTKVLLGTIGCFPAWDTFFDKGYKHSGFKVPSRMTSAFVEQVGSFCRANLQEFQTEQTRIELAQGMHYPMMKLVDMYFHQVGLELDTANSSK